ncbi:MAG: type II 3-dehydroquinate dehydratase [Oscillospiraceae bacterium]|nr:type II 3-dehydroquinate dehydratase [Oscillospiraceae bacterium]MBQ3242897.1 type II 3-dehydroquinate dehydratase [Oscillospiraceae bacterium]MBR2635990.1 type II 3-dehydroquinate dehydratase [Oscillospiraceae bacterium]MBR6608260.1 type II 3-dehydroquinate dehydratase [Oscillospiraceae bacterium]
MKKLLVIHGPNINLTGIREPGVYGSETIDQINREIESYCEKEGFSCRICQSNHEGQIIDWLHEAMGNYDGIILNAGAYTHYSYAIHDAIAAIRIPTVEVHFSNIQARADFRHTSVIAPVCVGSIAGFGKNSYLLAVDAFKKILA